MSFADRVKETTTVTGTGAVTLLGAVAGYRAVAAAYGIGDRVPYCIEGQTPGEWEIGSGTLTDSTHLARTTVTASSNSGALVNFSAGTKNVFGTPPAAELNKAQTVDTLAFATAIPLTVPGVRVMPQQTVSSALAFTAAASPVMGSLVYARLKADGTHTPTFTGMREWGGSSGWVNTTNILNVVQFFCDGTDVWYSIAQDADGAVELTAATAVTLSGPTDVVVNVASTNYTVGTNGTRSGSVVVTPTPVTNVTFTPSSVTLTAGTGTATFTATSTTTGAKTIAVTNGGGLTNPSNITLTVAATATAPGAPTIGTAAAGDTQATVTFTAPGSNGGSAITGYTATSSPGGFTGTLSGATAGPITVTGLTNGTAYTFTVTATNAVGTSSPSSASNSVTPTSGVTYARLGQLSSVTETGSSDPYGYTSTTSGGGFGTKGGLSTTKLQSGIDGSIKITVDSVVEFISGFTTSSTPVTYTSMPYALYSGGNDAYTPFTSGVAGTALNGLSRFDGDIWLWTRVGTTLSVSVARAATPTTFLPMFTWTGVSTGVLAFDVNVNSAGTFGNLVTTGFA